MYKLTITKVEYTLGGIHLDREERHVMDMRRILGGVIDQDIVKHITVLLEKSFTSGKKAWAYLTPELLDSHGLVWDGCRATYSNEYIEYYVTVAKI